MPNLFLNLPVPASTGAGAAVDVSQMGATKTLIVGGQVKGAVTLEYATDDTGSVWAPVPNGSFLGPGRVTIDLAAHWMRAVMDGSGSMNADVGAPAIPALFAQIGPAPVDISALASFKTVVSPAALLVEISEDGVSWSQAFSFPQKGGASSVVIGKFARCLTGTVWMAAAPTGDQPADDVDVEFPQPFTSPLETRIIYVRATGSDTTGDGKTIPTAYRTIQHAVLDVPLHIPGGVQYVVECTGLIDGGPEMLPPRYALPRWVAPRGFDAANFEFMPTFLVNCAVNITAMPRNVPALGADAVIAFEDLAPTVIGTSITNVTTGVDPEVTTSTPHGLFLAQDEFIQLVTIVDVTGAVSANGSWFVNATGPNTFIILGADTSGDPAYAGGGTASVLYEQDQNSGQIELKIAVPRASWIASGPDTLRGKLVLVPSGEHGIVYKNTDDTLWLTQVFPLGIAPGDPARITEQSAHLKCAPMDTVGFVGGFNAINQDSLALNGLWIEAASATFDDAGLFHMLGNTWVQGCRLLRPGFARTRQANSRHTWMTLADYFQGPIYQSSGLFDLSFCAAVDWWDNFGGTVFYAPLAPLGLNDDGGFAGWFGVKVIIPTVLPPDYTPPEFAYDIGSGNHVLNRLSVENGVNAFFAARGEAYVNGFGGDWSGIGLQVFGGAQVEVTNVSFNDDFSAGPNDMQVGTLDGGIPRTFANFRSAADGGEQLNQFDVSGFNANAAKFGAKGSGSRVYQIPFII